MSTTTTNPTDTSGYLTSADVARILRVSVWTVRRLTREGQLPAIRLSRKIVRYQAADLPVAALNQHTDHAHASGQV
jgi:excisionase family DNA binding protein